MLPILFWLQPFGLGDVAYLDSDKTAFWAWGCRLWYDTSLLGLGMLPMILFEACWLGYVAYDSIWSPLAWVCCLWFCRMPYWLEKSANLWFYLLAYYLRKLPIRFYLEPIGWKMPPMILTARLPLSHTGCPRFRALRNLDTLSYICYAKTVRALAFYATHVSSPLMVYLGTFILF